jgi:ribosomal protein S18 acetylase RimI-like enzyme
LKSQSESGIRHFQGSLFMTMKIKIRKFREEDAVQAFALNRALHTLHGAKATITLKQFIHACLRDKLANCFVAIAEGKVVGLSNSHDLINLGYGNRVCVVDQLYTHEKYRRHGIGLALMRRIAEKAIKRGCFRMEVSATKDNKISNAFYRKAGFFLRENKSNRYVLQGESLPQFVRQPPTKTGRRSKS